MEGFLIKNSKGIYTIYNERSVLKEKCVSNKSQSEVTVISEGVKKALSTVMGTEKEIIVLCQDNNSNIMVAQKDKPQRIVLRNNSNGVLPLNMQAIQWNNTLELFYTKDFGSEGVITQQHRREDGSWSTPTAIDRYINTKGFTKLVSVKGGYILIYTRNAPEQQIGYREICSNSTGIFKLLYATGYKIIDYSIAVTEDEIHLCAVVGSSRSNKLIYTKKDINGITKEKKIYEGFVKGCCIYLEKSKINIVYSTLSGVIKLTSFDMGTTFKKSEKLNITNFNKIPYIDYTDSESYRATEVIGDCSIPQSIYYPFTIS